MQTLAFQRVCGFSPRERAKVLLIASQVSREEMTADTKPLPPSKGPGPFFINSHEPKEADKKDFHRFADLDGLSEQKAQHPFPPQCRTL